MGTSFHMSVTIKNVWEMLNFQTAAILYDANTFPVRLLLSSPNLNQDKSLAPDAIMNSRCLDLLLHFLMQHSSDSDR